MTPAEASQDPIGAIKKAAKMDNLRTPSKIRKTTHDNNTPFTGSFQDDVEKDDESITSPDGFTLVVTPFISRSREERIHGR